MHGIRRILHVEAGSLLLLDEDSSLLEFKKILRGSQERMVGFKLKPGEGIAGYVVQKGEPLLVLDAQNDPRFCPRIDEAIGFVTRSILCVPLEVKDKVIGAIEVINRLDGQFDENDLWLLNYMAGSVAIALENARLYTELSDFARELKRSQAQLVQAEKLAAMGRLAASIAHEINNPLQAIHNCLHLTLKKPLNEEKKTRYLGMAQEEVDRLITIVQRMLEFYRPSREGMAPTDVHAIIENVLALSSKRLQRGKITVTRKLASDLPNINAVSDQLKQVFLNLVINAIEAMPQGGELCIETKLSEDGDRLSMDFTDTGVGLSEKEQENIFEPFFTTKATGTGLGLSVSYGIIERHGGRIEVQSELGKGATFTVYLPLNSPT
jgi:signal transduction histidine kinase